MSKDAGLFQQTLTVSKINFDCDFDYEAAERETSDEPGCEESLTLISARHADEEMIDLLDPLTIETLEEMGMAALGQLRKDSDYDRGQDRYEDRMSA